MSNNIDNLGHFLTWGIFGLIFLAIGLMILVLEIASLWILFQKADRPGFLAVIPFVGIFVLFDIAFDQKWYLGFLVFVPLVNVCAVIVLNYVLPTKFGVENTLFRVLAVLFPYVARVILAFGDKYQYQGMHTREYYRY